MKYWKFLKELRSIFEKNKIKSILEKNNQKILESNFWKNKSEAQKTLKEKKLYEDLINSYEKSIKELNDLEDLQKLAIEDNNQAIID